MVSVSEDGTPKGWHRLTPQDLQVYVNEAGTKLIVCGEPADDDEEHSCDYMGCGWSHVLYRADLNDDALAESQEVLNHHMNRLDDAEKERDAAVKLASASQAREALIRHALEAEMYDCANCDDIRDSEEFTSRACRKCSTGNAHRVLKMTEGEAQVEVQKQLTERDMYKGLFDGVCKQRDKFTEMLRERGVEDNEIQDVIASCDFEFTPSPAYDEWKAMRAVVEAAEAVLDKSGPSRPRGLFSICSDPEAVERLKNALAAWKEARP
jgi:hypothetical protein